MMDLENLKNKVDKLIEFCHAMAEAENEFKLALEKLHDFLSTTAPLINSLPLLHERMERIEKWIENEKKVIRKH